MKYYNHVIGIDPDTVKSGIAHLYRPTIRLEAFSLLFFELYDYLTAIKKEWGSDVIVIIEGGWLVEKSNFHISSGIKSGNKSDRIAKNVGSNHETGRKIVEMCEYLKIEYQVIKPLKKIWQGPGRKISHEELADLLIRNGFKPIGKSTNQEERDSCLLCLTYT